MKRNKQEGKLRGLSDKTSDIILVTICLVIVLLVAYPLYYVSRCNSLGKSSLCVSNYLCCFGSVSGFFTVCW